MKMEELGVMNKPECICNVDEKDVPYFPIDNARVIYTKMFSKRKQMTVRVIQWMRVMQLKLKKFKSFTYLCTQ
jgi:hypothetical protein